MRHRSVATATAAASGDFDPLGISWATALWADDPDASPPADGAEITSWVNAGSNTTAWTKKDTTGPTYRESSADMNNRATINMTAGSRRLEVLGSVASQPGSVVWVGYIVQAGADFIDGGSQRWLMDNSNTRLYAGFVVTGSESTGTSTKALLVADFVNASPRLWVNNTASISSGTIGSQNVNDIRIGGSTTSGDSAAKHTSFLGVKSGSVLTDTERDDITEWAADYYNITIA